MEAVKHIQGNLLDFPRHCKSDPNKYVGINAIAHSCNTQNVMGGGIASQIKKRYPSCYSSDCHAMMEGKNTLGNFSFAWTDASQSKGIYNMYNQDRIGGERAVNYEAFYTALETVVGDLEWQSNHDEEQKVLGLPYGVSCGLAGGNWMIVREIIEDVISNSSIKCYIVKFEFA